MHRNQMTHYSPMRRILNQRMVRTGMGASNYFQQTRGKLPTTITMLLRVLRVMFPGCGLLARALQSCLIRMKTVALIFMLLAV